MAQLSDIAYGQEAKSAASVDQWWSSRIFYE